MKYLVATLFLTLCALAFFPFLAGGGAAGEGDGREAPGVAEASRYGRTPGPLPGSGDVLPGGGAGTARRAPVPRPMMFPDDPVADVVFGAIRDIVSGRAGAGDREELEGRIAGILEEEGMGKADSRKEAAALTIATMLRRAEGQQVSAGPINPRQIEAMRIAASEVAIDLYRRLPMTVSGYGRHDGAALALTVQAEMPDGFEAVSWESIGSFPYQDGMALPPSVLDLHGRKLGACGYMMTLEEVEDIRQFLLVESIWACCFGMPPEVNQVILVNIPASMRGVEYTMRPVLVAGVFDVGEVVEDGFVTSLYRLQVEVFKEID